MINLKRVVLPEPEVPVRKTNSPGSILKVISQRAVISPNFFVRLRAVTIRDLKKRLIENYHTSDIHQPAGFLTFDRFPPNLDVFSNKFVQIYYRRYQINRVGRIFLPGNMMSPLPVDTPFFQSTFGRITESFGIF